MPLCTRKILLTVFFANLKLFSLNIFHVNSTVRLVDDIRFDFVSVDYLLKRNPYISYHKLLDPYRFTFEQFPGSLWPHEQPYDGTLGELFALIVPQGKVLSDNGFVIIDDRYVLRELAPTSFNFHHYVNHLLTTDYSKVRKVPGRVAVITKLHAQCYAHWLMEVLGRLAILEGLGIDFDWLYVSYNNIEEGKTFIKETLAAWGIPEYKIIDPSGEFHCVQADELVVPSLPNRHVTTLGKQFAQGTQLCAAFCHPWVVEYLRNKFLTIIKDYQPKNHLAKRVYISRKDAKNARNFDNEQDLIDALKVYDFELYELTKLPFLDQVKLFADAQMVVGAHGSGMTNIMFCSKDTQVVEIFMARQDLVNYNIAQVLDLNYTPIKTAWFDFFGHYNTTILPSSITDIINVFNFN
jgi:hypothetical protein